MGEVPVCQPPDRAPRRARLRVPEGAVDCHTHVFEDRFPLSPNRGYTPPESTFEQMRHMHGQLGIDRVILTQPSVYGTDNSAILQAVARIPDRARAVVAVDRSIDDDELARLHDRGARGIRLNLDNAGGMPVGLDEVPRLAERIRPLGWHLEFLFAGDDIGELAPLLRRVPVPVSIGHFGYMSAAAGVDAPSFRALVELVRDGNTWVKLSAPNRLGAGDLPPWDEVVPMAQQLIEANPDRMVWGSDWPHPNKYGDQPNDADLLDQLERWAPDPDVRRRILVDNPAALYGFRP